MLIRSRAAFATCLVAVLLISTGCVGKGLFRKNAEDADSRVHSIETAVEANQHRIKDLSEETDDRIADVADKVEKAVQVGTQAMNRAGEAAEAAELAAQGKLLWNVTLANDRVKFNHDQTTVPREAATILDDLIGRVKTYSKAVYLEIEGHTDNIGGEEYNYALGEKRAVAVRDYLSRGGVPLHAMSTISYGESQPVSDNDTREGRAQNRRVVVKVLE